MNNPSNQKREARRQAGRPLPLWRRASVAAWNFLPSRAELHEHRHGFALAALSGLLIRLAYHPFNLSALAFVALLPLFWGLRRCPPRMAFWVGLVFGTIHGIWGTWWTIAVARFNPLIYLGVLPASVWWGLHMAVALAAIALMARRLSPWPALIAAMAAWWAMEHFRSVGRIALPVGFLGHTQSGWLEVAQLASLAGIPLISALIIGTNLSLMEMVAAIRARYGHGPAAARLAFTFGLVAAGCFYGSRVMRDTEARYAGPDAFDVRVALVQTGIDQKDKFQSYGDPDETVRRSLQDKLYASLNKQLATINPGEVDLIVTPESSLTHDFVDVEEHVQVRLFGGAILWDLLETARELRTPIVVGGVDNVFATEEGDPTELIVEGLAPDSTFNPGHQVYGALWLLRPEDQFPSSVATYRKTALMPFGEEVPYLDLIPGFQEHIVQVGTFAKAKAGPPTGMLIGNGATEDPREVRLGFSICFEDLIPSLHRGYAAHQVQLFVNATNDAWFDGFEGPRLHFEMARWRSIENRIPMARCTNSGITAIIGPSGEIAESLPAMKAEIMKSTVRVLANPTQTPYRRIGDLPGWICLLVVGGLCFRLIRNPAKE